MKQLLTFIKKEFHHILRDTLNVGINWSAHCSILIFGFAITNEVRNTNIAILDNAKDEATQEYNNKN